MAEVRFPLKVFPSVGLNWSKIDPFRRLPAHYVRQYKEWEEYKKNCVSSPHELPRTSKWELEKFGAPRLACNVPIRVHYPDQCDEGIWGGVGIVEGLIMKEKRWFDAFIPKLWRPGLKRRVFYSEILDKYLIITSTLRTLELVDQYQGFDNYILQTHPVNLHSQLAIDIRRQMLIVLARETNSELTAPNRAAVLRKYKEFAIPLEEAEWFGLTLEDAHAKQEQIDAENERENIRPLKDIFREQLIIRLANGEDSIGSVDEPSSSAQQGGAFRKLQFWKKA